ncbi:Dehydrogenase/reductase SDR family member 7B [Pseudocercospora fuligena]|uniref:Dehydrogenase/reductase SDR family member 7B n=1 Tax=Pseudocercospora fuligena TaxID=685502 RepID=A0A8H6VEH0_9PEZI|nr:Dehydrogenase/reductase SDR family member 7B [Pseudocercospora fuligena]
MAYLCKTDLPKEYDVYPYISADRFTDKLKNKTVVITGASTGIGKATALAFAAAGANIALVARRKPLLNELVAEVKKKHGESVKAVAVQADLSEREAPKQVVAQVEQALGPIDILVNSAAAQIFGRFQDIDFEDWWTTFELNMRAPAAMVYAVLPSMTARKSGIIINIGSTSGAYSIPWQTSYAVPKAALIKFNQNIAWELEPYGILTFCVHPGNVQTDLANKGFEAASIQFQEKQGFITPKVQELLTPYQNPDLKMQTPELSANTIVALCADERCKILHGLYIDSEQNLDKVLEAAEKGRVKDEKLYLLKVEEV